MHDAKSVASPGGDNHLGLFIGFGRGVVVSSASTADLAVHVLLICRHSFCRGGLSFLFRFAGVLIWNER
jgi:hypothetical protein